MKQLSFLFPPLGFLFIGCHSVRRIDMLNNTADTVRITWKLNEDSLSGNPFFISSSKDVVFTLVPPKTKIIRMSFGQGNWSLKEVAKLSGFLESVEIASAQQTTKLDSVPQIRDFLLARRKGIAGARIEIAVPR